MSLDERALNMTYKPVDENNLKLFFYIWAHVICESFKGLNLLLTDGLVSGNSKV
jgi:hypothetical protein